VAIATLTRSRRCIKGPPKRSARGVGALTDHRGFVIISPGWWLRAPR
jgi:hypothetical protein